MDKYIKKDKALTRRFDYIEIKEPDDIMTKDILYKIKNNYKKYHNINLTNKNLDLSIDFDEYYLYGNSDLLKEVWLNLIDNAIKYSYPNTTIEINIVKIIFTVNVRPNNQDTVKNNIS